jgi:hypothetical protein
MDAFILNTYLNGCKNQMASLYLIRYRYVLSPLMITKLVHFLRDCYPKETASIDCATVTPVESKRIRFVGTFWEGSAPAL